MFITFEGVDGSGKTTQIRKLAEYLAGQGYEVVCTREPGGSEGAEAIRGLLLSGAADRWSADAEILLFTAARRDHLEKLVWPALDAGRIVLCDRFFDSTRAYQGQRSAALLEKAEQLHDLMIGQRPDLTLLLDIDPELALPRSLARLSGSASSEDRFENAGLEFQKGLRQAYLGMALAEPSRFLRIDASRGPQEVAEAICMTVSDILASRADMELDIR